MTTETRKRIRAYKKALPELRERVIAVALLLAMSASMMGTASFAWITISRNPEIAGASTSIAANGNLEIALATSEGRPEMSQVGDSSAAEGQTITGANITWGNLVNLSDESYGLANLTLRPAQLNENALLTSPLYGAVFTPDGRVEKLTSNFSYTSWVPPTEDGTKPGYFGVSDELGVRAISSTKMEVVGYIGTLNALRDKADGMNAQALAAYRDLAKEEEWMTALANVIGIHMTATLNHETTYTDAEVSSADLQSLIALYGAFIEIMETEAQAMADLLNYQLYAAHAGNTDAYSDYDAEKILEITTFETSDGENYKKGDFVAATVEYDDGGTVKQKVVKITDLKTFIKDYNMLIADKATMEAIDKGGDRRWTTSGMKDLVKKLVVLDDCILKFDKDKDSKTVKKFLADFSDNPLDALGYRGKNCTATITNGVIYNMDQRTGAGFVSPRMDVTAKMYVSALGLGEQSATVHSIVNTSAETPSIFGQDLKHGATLNTGAGSGGTSGTAVAQDTYGLAIDLWVRTNAPGSYLTLEGNVLTKEEEVPDTGKDSMGNVVELYTMTRVIKELDEEGNETGKSSTLVYTLYQKEQNSVITWYDATTHNLIELQEGESPTQKMKTEIIVLGYEGENRVWNSDEDKTKISVDATTQGSGSCYIYYADSPEDQARSLELLKAMRVAFVNESGALLAMASMNTEQRFEESGRVIVPLQLDPDSLNIGSDDENIYAIMPLQANTPTRITAIVFLDGVLLANDNVLSASDIQGQLNIQLGNSTFMEPIRNETLELAERKVSASVTRSEFDYDTDPDMTTTVQVVVTGDKPEKVTAFFLRKINDSQGSREPVMKEFVYDQATNMWTCDYKFTAPGVYVLRTVELDGQEYPLPFDDENPLPTVTVKGFSIEQLLCKEADENNEINVLTAEKSSQAELTLRFATDDPEKMPKTVQGRFLREDGTAVNVNFVYNATSMEWKGTANFISSGKYTFKYLVLNGEYTELPESLWQTANIRLGMYVEVYTTNREDFKFERSTMVAEGNDLLRMQVKIRDNSGEELVGLSGAKLKYCLSTLRNRELDADLTWTTDGYYYGELRALEGGPGTWVFKEVLALGSSIDYASVSPLFTMRPPDEPCNAEVLSTSDYLFKPNGDAFVEAKIQYTSTSKVSAVFTNRQRSSEFVVSGTPVDGKEDTWRFTIPHNDAGKQDGFWTLTELRVWEYYKKDGTYVTVNDPPKVFAGSSLKNSEEIQVVHTYTITMTGVPSNALGKNGTQINAAFMDSYTISGLGLTVKDAQGNAIPNTTVTMSYEYLGGSLANGGYNSTYLTAGQTVATLEMVSSDGKTFTQNGSFTVQQAGNYAPKLSVKVYGQEVPLDKDDVARFAFGVYSVTPKVVITEAYYESKTHDKKAAAFTNTSNQSSASVLSTTVYFEHYETSTTVCGVTTKYKAYEQPYVTLKLSELGNASEATLTFGTSKADGKVHLYLNSDQASSKAVNNYTWTKDDSCKRYVGYWESQTGDDKYAEAGTLTTTELVLTYNSKTYTVPVSITINNPG